MSSRVLLDTGPLVSMLDKRDQHHRWATDVAARFPHPWHTCEPVVTEACYLLRAFPEGMWAILNMLQQGLMTIDLHLAEEAESVDFLMRRYENVRMSLADACLVRMSELTADCVVLTLDSDFRVYRRHRRTKIPLLMPPSV